MTTYNVAVPVVTLIEARSEEDAIRQFSAHLQRDGYEVYEGELPEGANAFESETVHCEVCDGQLVAGQGDGNVCGPCTERAR